MIKSYEFIIKGQPTPKGRPRFTRNRIAYTPKKTKEATEIVRSQIRNQLNAHGGIDIEHIARIECDVTYFFAYPKSYTKKKKQQIFENGMTHTIKPDLDNLDKLLFDAANGLVWHDDCQITASTSRKYYTESENGHTEMRVTIFFNG